ncbi:MAG: hypothetical protein ACLFQ0_19205 [Cyclobacteriaceae bacterium]
MEEVNESQPKKGIEVIKVTHLRYDITNTSSNAKLIDRDMQVNTCTNRVDRYRVRLYEEIVHYGLGNGTFEIVHGFRVYSFRRTIYGWERRFKTSALAGRVDYQGSYGSGGKYIQANGKQHSIGWELATVQYGSFNEQYIYWSRGEAWGRNGCYCSYEESYP